MREMIPMKYILKFLCRLFLVLDATFLVIVIFIINDYFSKMNANQCIYTTICYIAVLILLIMILGISIAKIAIFLTRFLQNDNLVGKFKEINDTNSSYLASYLGYFFVALSINNRITLGIIYFLILLFAWHTLNQYYNPIFIIIGYHFYSIKTNNNVVVLVITKRFLRSCETNNFKYLRRIYDGCYLDEEE